MDVAPTEDKVEPCQLRMQIVQVLPERYVLKCGNAQPGLFEEDSNGRCLMGLLPIRLRRRTDEQGRRKQGVERFASWRGVSRACQGKQQRHESISESDCHARHPMVSDRSLTGCMRTLP